MMNALFLVCKYLICPIPWLVVKIILRGYGAVITRNLTTQTHGLFKIYRKKNVHVGNHCRFHTGVIIQGRCRVEIEENVVFSPRCMLMDSGLDVMETVKGDGRAHIDSFIHIKRHAWIAAGAIILPGVTVGEHAVVGAGSVVTKDVAPYTIVAGNPAVVIERINPPSDS
jgi:acetyltransferase-like isoleucine patch superfamily enzyme